MSGDKVEAVAQAFYATEAETCDWDTEPEELKEQYRQDARAAIAALEQPGRKDRFPVREAILHLVLAGMPWLSAVAGMA